MIHEFLTNKWIRGAVGFIILFAGVCYLWYQHETAPYRQEAAETAVLMREWESSVNSQRKTKETADVPDFDETLPSASESITNTKMKTVESDDMPVNPLGDTPITVTDEQVLVSPFGFGPYPKVPDDYPSEVDWTTNDSPNAELLQRVLVKLWTEGEKNFRGGGTHRGKVYPWYHNTIYVRFHSYKNADGEIIRRANAKMSGPRVNWSGVDFLNPPPHIRILELDSSGFDPYQYLDLPYKKGENDVQ